MSYGVWKKRGKDWSSFELDGCDRRGWERMPEFRRRILLNQASPLGLCDRDDPSYVVWHVGQARRGRKVSEVPTGGDHALWVSYRNEEALARALRANGYESLDGRRSGSEELFP